MIKKVVLRSLVILVLVIILILALLPGITRRYAINHSKELVGRQIHMGKLKLNYFTGLILITDFVMYETDEKTAFVSFDTLKINLAPFQFFVDDFVMESFYLKGLKAKVIQHDSTFNFDDLVAFHAPQDDTLQQDIPDETPFRFHLSNIELKNAEFVFVDQNIGKTTDLKDLSFFVPYIGWNQEDKSEAGLRFAFKNEGYFESSINVDPIGGEFEAEITVFHLYLDAFKEYVANSFKVNSFNGIFNSRISINGNLNEIEKSLVNGYAEVNEFEMTDLQDRKFLGANKVECIIKEIDVFNMSFIFDTIVMSEPYVYFELDTSTNNFYEIFDLATESGTSPQNEEELPQYDTVQSHDSLYYAINFIQIDQGVIDYRDNLTGEPFDYYLSEIALQSDSIESTSEWIDLYAGMLLNKRGTLKAEVGFNPANPMDISLQYVITDFMLSDLNIYSRFYMGFPIVYGDMYYKSETEIFSGQLTSENKLIITHVELGDKTGGLYDLPLKFALFLLKDRDGVITLDIPVRGDLNDPTVRLGKIIWTTFKNLIIKVAAAPFDLLAGLLSVDPKDIQSIDYQYADTALTAERQKQLDLLLELEQKKEGLEIELVYFNDTGKEKEAIAITEAGKQFLKETSKDFRNNEADFRNFLQAKAGSDTLDIAAASLRLSNPQVLDSLVVSFAEVRKSQIAHYLYSMNDSTSIYITTANPSAPKNTGSVPVFEVKYSIKGEHSGGSEKE